MSNHSNFQLPNPDPPDLCLGESRIGILAPGQTMSDYIGHSVINLSQKSLTLDQTNALSKGLTFCPTPWEPDMCSIIDNLEDFFRKMRLKAHFHKLAQNAKEAAYLEKLMDNKGKLGRKTKASFMQSQSNTLPPPQTYQLPLPVIQFGKSSGERVLTTLLPMRKPWKPL